MTGNSVHVQLQLLLRAGNLTVKYDDIQKHARLYRVYVRRAQDNWTVRGAAGAVLSPRVPCKAAQAGTVQSSVKVNTELSLSHTIAERFLGTFYCSRFPTSWWDLGSRCCQPRC